MTFRDRHLATFRRQPLDRVVWQPRLEHWYAVNKHQGTLPERYRDMSHLEVYDDLGCSVRAYHLFNATLRAREGEGISTTAEVQGDCTLAVTHTPVGELRQVARQAALSHHIVEFPVKTPADMRVMEHILRARTVEWDEETYRAGVQALGDRGASTLYLPRVPIQRFIIEFMGFENTIYALHDWPAETERLIRVVEETDDAYYDVVKASPIEIINLGDNVDSEMISAPLFERYYLPYYQRRAAELRAAGKYGHSHWDGRVKPILRYAQATGLDGLEALTPLPQGDVTLEEIKEGLGDEMILIDGIPATHFLPQTSYQELEQDTLKILDMFAPNLVLGISDEISPPGDIEKVRLVSEIVAGYTPRRGA